MLDFMDSMKKNLFALDIVINPGVLNISRFWSDRGGYIWMYRQ
jgi:hypothetical protein